MAATMKQIERIPDLNAEAIRNAEAENQETVTLTCSECLSKEELPVGSAKTGKAKCDFDGRYFQIRNVT
jgi:hypothetical protein